MNLQQVLSYRDTCFICQEKLVYFLPGYPNLVFLTDDKGFYIRSGHKQGIKMDFNFDGSYQRNKRNYNIYQSILDIRKHCINCPLPIKISDIKDQETIITVNSILNKEYYYTFTIYQLENTYEVMFNWEAARYRDGQQFFHIYNNHYVNKGELHHATFDKSLEDILHLNLPNTINLTNVKNIEDFTNKCKLLINFS
jgi:hypothetical protein